MKKNFKLIQLFSIIDGRLSTDIGDVYEMLNHICDDDLMTHHLPIAMRYLQQKAPTWFKEQRAIINEVKKRLGDESFLLLIEEIKNKYPLDIEVPQLKDEFDTSKFSDFMIKNSLLMKKAAKKV